LSELSAGRGMIKSLQRQQRYLSPASRDSPAATASRDEKRTVFIRKKNYYEKENCEEG